MRVRRRVPVGAASGTKLSPPLSVSLSGLDADLLCLVLLAALCFSGALVGVVLLFVYFDGCAVRNRKRGGALVSLSGPRRG